jgi:ribosomal protein L1
MDLMRVERPRSNIKRPVLPCFFAHVLINIKGDLDWTQLRGRLSLPHGMGRRDVAVFTRHKDLVKKAKKAGVLHAGGLDFAERIKEWKNIAHLFQRFVATKEMVEVYENDPELRDVLKRNNFIPSEFKWTLVEPEELLDVVAKHQQLQYMTYRINTLSRTTEIPLGYVQRHSYEQITDNLHALIRHLFDRQDEIYGESFRCRRKDKGKYIIRVNLSRTMGRGSYMINLPKLLADMGLFEEARKIHYLEKTTWQQRAAWAKRENTAKITEIQRTFWRDCIKDESKGNMDTIVTTQKSIDEDALRCAEQLRIMTARSDKAADRAMNELASVSKNNKEESDMQSKDGIMMELAQLAGTDRTRDEQIIEEMLTMDSNPFPIDAFELDEDDRQAFSELLTGSPYSEMDSISRCFDGKEQSQENSYRSQTENDGSVTDVVQVGAKASKSETDRSTFQEEVESSKNRADELLDEIAALLEEEEDVFPSFQFSDEKKSHKYRHKKVKKFI